MSLRIISGSAKGVVLARPKGVELRPTTDRVREALFSILLPRLDGARFCDLYAGTGANGIEALSRGAAGAVLADSDVRALNAVTENLSKAHLAAKATVLRLRLPDELAKIPGVFDVVFADPPYDQADYGLLVDAVAAAGLVAAGGWFIVEHRSRAGLPEAAGRLNCFRCNTYGETALTFYA